MANTHIQCPHCKGLVNIELHVFGKEKNRGPKPHQYDPDVEALIVTLVETKGLALKTICNILMEKNIKTARGGDKWYPQGVQRVYKQIKSRVAE